MRHDPAWIRIALAVQSLLLLLYPKAYRRRFAGEMRQTLRDRLRELSVDAPLSRVWEVARLSVDALRGAAHAQGDQLAAWSTRRRALALALLASLGVAMTSGRESLAGHLADAGNALQHAYVHIALLGPSEEFLDLQQVAADALIASGDSRSMALAGHLLVASHPLQPRGVDRIGGVNADHFARRALRLAAESLRDSQAPRLAQMKAEGAALIAAAAAKEEPLAVWLRYLACDTSCSASMLADRLVGSDPGNGYYRLLQAIAAEDGHVAYRALARLADAPRYRTPYADMLRDSIAAYRAHPAPTSLRTARFYGQLEVRRALGITAWIATGMPALQQLAARCLPDTVANRPDWRQACIAGLTSMAENASEAVDILVARRLLARLHGEGSPAHRQYRQLRWITDVANRGRSINDEVELILSGVSEAEWLAGLSSRGDLKQEPPEDFDDRLWR